MRSRRLTRAAVMPRVDAVNPIKPSADRDVPRIFGGRAGARSTRPCRSAEERCFANDASKVPFLTIFIAEATAGRT